MIIYSPGRKGVEEMEKLTMINGNGETVEKLLPKIVILTDYINNIALDNITKNTGLVFIERLTGYDAQPQKSNQIARLLLTYNFKTCYYDNCDILNTLILKFDHHVGFHVDSICNNCCIDNNIPVHGLNETSKLSC